MYIDVALINDFNNKYPAPSMSFIESFVEQYGVWYQSIESVRDEWGNPEATLEQICFEYYFVIEDNQMKFCNPIDFWDDVDESFSST